jgi:hypothetical protein
MRPVRTMSSMRHLLKGKFSLCTAGNKVDGMHVNLWNWHVGIGMNVGNLDAMCSRFIKKLNKCLQYQVIQGYVISLWVCRVSRPTSKPTFSCTTKERVSKVRCSVHRVQGAGVCVKECNVASSVGSNLTFFCLGIQFFTPSGTAGGGKTTGTADPNRTSSKTTWCVHCR